MRRSNSSFALAACGSLALHAAVFVILPRYASGLREVGWDTHDPAKQQPVVPERVNEMTPPPEFEMGEATGTGYASQHVDDPLDSTALEADADQALLSLDPSGLGERGTDAAVARAAGAGSRRGGPGELPPILVAEADAAAASGGPIARFGMRQEAKLPRRRSAVRPELLAAGETPEMPEKSRDSEQPTEPSPESVAGVTQSPLNVPEPVPPPAQLDVDIPQPVAETDSASHATEAVAAAAQPVESARKAASAAVVPAPPSPADAGSATAGAAQQPAADPARMSDSESDPFSRIGSATFRDGGLSVRFGRKVKTRKPRLLLAAAVDLISLRRAKVVLQIDIDATGKVTGVEITKSSGSNEIDQPTRVAVYDWWFEPKKNAEGLPVSDQVQFTISWQ